MPNEIQSPNDKKYNLEERMASFGENVIMFAKTLPINHISKSLISQVIRASTSIGGNYMEADGAESKKDFEFDI